MKKLLFAIAGAASFAALAADPAKGDNDISIVGFENYTADQTVIGYGDDGQEGGSLWSATGDDASLVKTLGGDNAAVPSITEPRPFAGETNTKYLALDTNGSELQRAVGTTVAATGTYIDTLVQFTPSESAPTSTDLDGAKLAIWLGVDSENNTTNLMVQACYWDFADAPVGTSQAFALTGKTIEPGTWYRLTVKAIDNIMNADSGLSIPAFQILVDGTEMTLASGPLSSGFLEILDQSSMYGSADIQAAIAANKLVPSIQAEAGQYGAAVTLTSVGFKGTGALDDFVVTTEAPAFGPATIDFSLTWPASGVTASYKIDDGEPVELTGAGRQQIQVPEGSAVQLILQNADGATKTYNVAEASSEANAIDASAATFTWADYLGDAVDGAYEIDNLAELKLFQKGIAITTNELKLATAGETFKLTADITLDEAWPGVGVQNGKDIWSTADFNAAAFQGTFDGQNHTISGFQMVGGNLDYCGFFNSTYGATIQNLKIQYAGSLFAVDSASSTEECGATFVGVAKESTLQNLTSLAGTVSCGKGFGGVAGFVTSGTTVEYCTNNVNVTSLAGNKAGGVVMITQGGTGTATIRNCVNNGTTTGNAKQKGGIIGYLGTDGSVVIENCINNADSEPTFFSFNKGTVTVNGVNKAPDSAVPCKNTSGAVIAVSGLKFATVDNGVATFVADGALAAGNAYKVMAPATAAYEFTAAGSISFDTNMIQAVTFAITAPGLDLTDATESGVITFTAAAQGGAEDWVPDATEIPAETSAATQYPSLDGTALATADAKELTEWAQTNNVVFADVVSAAGGSAEAANAIVDAFLLNCAPAEVATEKEEFKATITVGADGTISVATPDGKDYNGTLQLKGKVNLSDAEWTPVSEASSTYHFYMYELSL